MKIAMIKLYNGDFIMGEVDENNSDSKSLHIGNPRQLMMMPTMAGSMGMALKPICFPFRCERLKNSMNIEASQILFTLWEEEIDTDIINGYKSEVSGIKIASAAEAASFTSASKSASPKELII